MLSLRRWLLLFLLQRYDIMGTPAWKGHPISSSKENTASGAARNIQVRCKLRFSPITYKCPQFIISSDIYHEFLIIIILTVAAQGFRIQPIYATSINCTIHNAIWQCSCWRICLSFPSALGQTTPIQDTVSCTRMLLPQRQLYVSAYSSYKFKEQRGNISVCSFIRPFHSKTKITKKGL